MTLLELYNLKLHEYKTTSVRERPWKLLAILLLAEIDKYESFGISQGDFYEKYKTQIDEKITKIEKDFKFTKEDIIKYIEELKICSDYESDKLWFIFGEGLNSLTWGLQYKKEKTPEELYSEYFESNDLSKHYNLEETAIAYNIDTTNLSDILNKILKNKEEFFTKICEELTTEEFLFILSQLENKKCSNCTNSVCQATGHINFGKLRKIQGEHCDDWTNKEIIGRAKVLRETDINKLK